MKYPPEPFMQTPPLAEDEIMDLACLAELAEEDEFANKDLQEISDDISVALMLARQRKLERDSK